MNSHRTAVRRSDSWDMDFYLLVVSDVSTHMRALRRTASSRTRKPNEIRGLADKMRVLRTCRACDRKSGDTGFWKPPDSWVSDWYLDPKQLLQIVDVISFYPRDRIPLYLFPSGFVWCVQVDNVVKRKEKNSLIQTNY